MPNNQLAAITSKNVVINNLHFKHQKKDANDIKLEGKYIPVHMGYGWRRNGFLK